MMDPLAELRWALTRRSCLPLAVVTAALASLRAEARRAFLGRAVGAAALASLLAEARGDEPAAFPNFKPAAKRVIYLFQSGAPSQLDLFDHKPKLKDLFAAELPASVRMGQRLTGMTA